MIVRIELHLQAEDVKKIDKKAKEQGRSRKNYCEQQVLKSIKQ